MEFIDREWDEAEAMQQKSVFYKCQMLNGGWCIKAYKPAIAQLICNRGGISENDPVQVTNNPKSLEEFLSGFYYLHHSKRYRKESKNKHYDLHILLCEYF